MFRRTDFCISCRWPTCWWFFLYITNWQQTGQALSSLDCPISEQSGEYAHLNWLSLVLNIRLGIELQQFCQSSVSSNAYAESKKLDAIDSLTFTDNSIRSLFNNFFPTNRSIQFVCVNGVPKTVQSIIFIIIQVTRACLEKVRKRTFCLLVRQKLQWSVNACATDFIHFYGRRCCVYLE